MKSSSFFPRRTQSVVFILILTLASQACAISLLEWPAFPTAGPTNPNAPTGPTPTPLPRAEVTFTVRLPDPLPANELLVVSILDEVTGLALNAVDYQMTAVDAITYTAKLAIPDQAMLKYRYTRRGAARVNEDTNLDGGIRYRMLHVVGPTQVTDTLNSWADKPVGTVSGNIFGTVLNADTSVPIPDILVTAGGVQTVTDSAGRFQLLGLRGGMHNFLAYAMDGSFQTFQQGATVAENQSTPVDVRMKPAQLVNVIFTVSVPQGTEPGMPLRLAGNLLQLGNTFSDLRGGLSTVADRMPTLSLQPDGRYSVSLFLPAGADIEYKYTLGDGFWNSEFTSTGQYATRHLIVPPQNTMVEDVVQSWQTGPNGPILFEVTAPPDTPIEDTIYIQFNPYGWTPPMPMRLTGTNKWAFKLYGPLNIVGSFGYRYCRNAQCDSADDAQTAGPVSRGHTVTPSLAPQDIIDTVNEWIWPQKTGSPSLVAIDIPSRGTGFIAGTEFQSYYEPNVPTFLPNALKNIQALGSNWVFLTPSWTYVRNNPLIFSEQPGRDAFWSDTVTSVTQARAINLNVALFPQPHFATNMNDFWGSAPRDSNWWNIWFDHYRAFLVHFADLASLSGSQALVIGGDWVVPALPAGELVDGTPSGVPADAETHWKSIIAEVRQHFRGTLIFALPYDTGVISAPVNILTDTDIVYLLWFAKLSDQATPNKADLLNETGRLLDQNVAPIQVQVNKPIIIGLSYPSSTYSATGCIPDGNGGCNDWTALNRPNPDLSTVNLDLQQQVDLYDAIFNAVNGRTWITGLISRGYFVPVALQDKSASIHGKPAADVLWYWFPRLLGNIK
jgi:hypothetical protein